MSRDNKYGYIDVTGQLVVPIEYDSAPHTYSEGLANVKQGHQWQFIDKTGVSVLRLPYREVRGFSEGVAPVQSTEGKWGFIDRRGAVVVAPQYDVAFPFQAGVAWVGIETTGSRLHQFVADVGAEEFTWFVIDKSGKRLEHPRVYEEAPHRGLRPFREGGPLHAGGLYGFVNPAGEIVVKPQYREARMESEGYAAALGPEGWVFIDSKGDVALGPYRHDLIGFGFVCGLVGFRVYDVHSVETEYYDMRGVRVWPQ